MPTTLSGPFTGTLLTCITPREGGPKPATSFIKEDLPQPDGPTTAVSSPAATDRLRCSTASVPCAPPNFRVTSAISTKFLNAMERAQAGGIRSAWGGKKPVV